MVWRVMTQTSVASAKIAFLVAISICSLAANQRAFAFTVLEKNPDGDVFVPAVEFSHPVLRTRILFVGMVHGGPSTYYPLVSRLIQNWSDAQNGPTAVLEEFFTCRGEALDLEPEGVNGGSLTTLEDEILSKTFDRLIKTDESELKKTASVFGLRGEPCEIDVDGNTSRPSFMVKRAQRTCERAHNKEFSCQRQDFKIPYSERLERRHGDFQVDQMAFGFQFLAALMYRMGEINGVDPTNKVWSKLEDEQWQLTVEAREAHLLASVRGLMAEGYRSFVLPWGAWHVIGVKKALLAEGYGDSNAQPILWMRKENLGYWDSVDQVYNNKDWVGDHFDF